MWPSDLAKMNQISSDLWAGTRSGQVGLQYKVYLSEKLLRLRYALLPLDTCSTTKQALFDYPDEDRGS